MEHSDKMQAIKPFLTEGRSYKDMQVYPTDEQNNNEKPLTVSPKLNDFKNKRKFLTDFIEWYREDDMSKFTPSHLADWYLKVKSQENK